MRHFDRGWGMADEGQFEQHGVRLRGQRGGGHVPAGMIADVPTGGDFFDPDFFAYREDADVAWRAQLLGWRPSTRRRQSATMCAA